MLFSFHAVRAYLEKMGYAAFHTSGTLDSIPRSGAWRRGVIAIVDKRCKTKRIDEFSWKDGQALAISVQDILFINSYVKPHEEALIQQVQYIDEMFAKLQWAGKWLCGGDWNEKPSNGWAETLAQLHGGFIQDCNQIQSTRWNGRAVIDFWLGNVEMKEAQVREEKVSDHRIVTTEIMFHPWKDKKLLRFKQHAQFTKPDWISQTKWQLLFEQAINAGEREDWITAIQWVEELDWESEADAQQLVDFQWATACARTTWAFAHASAAALAFIPDEYDNTKAMLAMVKNANCHRIKGVDIKLQERSLQCKSDIRSIKMRKLYKKVGRLSELHRRLMRFQIDNVTNNLKKKLFPDLLLHDVFCEVCIWGVVYPWAEDSKHWTAGKECKCQQMESWHAQWNQAPKLNWINKQGSLHSPMVCSEEAAKNDDEGLQMIHAYWRRLWSSQSWKEDERQARTADIIEAVNKKLNGCRIDASKPSLADFQHALRRISGTHGIDGWSFEELKVVASSATATSFFWDSMALWEEECLIPSPLKHCKLVMIPKKDNAELNPSQFRPICVLSSVWRAWSSSWIRSPILHQWISHVFPAIVSGGLPGSIGPEVLAAMIDEQLQSRGHGISLDFKHAFDTVDLKMMHCAIPAACSICNATMVWRSFPTMAIYGTLDCAQGQCTPLHPFLAPLVSPKETLPLH